MEDIKIIKKLKEKFGILILAIICALPTYILTSLDDSNTNDSALVMGEFCFSQFDKKLSFKDSSFPFDKMEIMYAEGGNLTTFKARLYKNNKIIGNAFSGHPGYFGVKDVDNDGLKEVLTGSYSGNLLNVYKFDGKLFRISNANAESKFYYLLYIIISRCGFIVIPISVVFFIVCIWKLWKKIYNKLSSFFLKNN